MPKAAEDRSAGVSRRSLLQTVGAAGMATIIAGHSKRAAAVIKISKAAVGYQDHPNGDKHCAKCAQFQPPNSCKMVDGPVSPQGYCRIFSPLRQADRAIGVAPTG